MKLSEFVIGGTFWTAAGEFRCTDVGTRTVVAVKLDSFDSSWLAGPPYAVAELLFDEDDLMVCYCSEQEMALDSDGPARLETPAPEDPLSFDRWVNDHNPHPELSYGKGWWDFVGVIRRLSDKLEINDISTVATFLLHTPPPTEELLSPVVRMLTPQCCVHLKEDFGQLSAPWTLSVERFGTGRIEPLHCFISSEPLDSRSLLGFAQEWIFPAYSSSEVRFTVRVEDEWDLYAILRLLTAQ